MIRYIADEEHYAAVLSRAAGVKNFLWIGTADIKDLYIEEGGRSQPFLVLIEQLLSRGVNVRLIHAKEPGPNFRADFDKLPRLYGGLERVLCPRVHFKLMIFDGTLAYIGSANLTGAGMGMKSAARRNFEAGLLTDDPELVAQTMTHFDRVWAGLCCSGCGRRDICPDPISV